MNDRLRFDIAYRADGATIQPHHCRQWEDGVGCYGTNPNHGFTTDEACAEMVAWHEQQAQLWREKKHPDLLYYTEQEIKP